ncbi:MAG: ABC transporter ATP-binding protein [Hyphomonadaceae bacterium]|nr:ABC transporter ATP-binding protein [Hyphomonadaceae bacterium]
MTKVYDTGEVKVHALRGVDLDIKNGELIVLLGPSGSGKSTLLNILGGLDRPTEGEVIFRGETLTDFSDARMTKYRRHHVGFIFQFYNLVPSLTARENVALVTEIADDPIAPDEALDMVGLADRMHHFPAELSGGEQQRVAVARAIAKRPEILFCDEPTGALDSKTGVHVLEALEDVNRRLGATTLIITHNVGIADMADRVFRFKDGRIDSIEIVGRRRKPSEISW